MINAHILQFRLKFDYALFIIQQFKLLQNFEKKNHFSIDVNGDVAQKLSIKSYNTKKKPLQL